jgi:hypothetical protein
MIKLEMAIFAMKKKKDERRCKKMMEQREVLAIIKMDIDMR